MYICSVCQYASTSKLGKCPDCQSFGSFELVPGSEGGVKKGKTSGKVLETQHTNKHAENIFYSFKNETYHRVFSGGIKQGGVYLLGGEPGIGKSTIVLQLLQQIQPLPVAYFSGEEQVSEIVRRAERVSGGLHADTAVFHATALEDIVSTIQDMMPRIIILDSIQTVSSSDIDGVAGSPAQVKYCSEKIVSYCRQHNITFLCLGHVTKGGEIAGPKYLEHIVDVVLYLDGDRFGEIRVLRCVKNRFGSADDAIVFTMTPTGLQVVGHDFRLHDGAQSHEGRVLAIGLENGRPILVHVEALLTKNYNNHPQRNALGIDAKRLQLIIAILEKYCGCKLFGYDIFVNIPGEFSFYDSGIDLAIAAAIYSQYKNTVPDPRLVYIGEIGLSGQIVKPRLYEKRTHIIDESLTLVEGVGKRVEKVLRE